MAPRLRFGLHCGLLAVPLFSAPAFSADDTTQQWRMVEIALTSARSYVDPFRDVDVSADFSVPGAQAVTRPAFWDGGNTWKVRFAAPKTGLWTMTTRSTDTTNAGLHRVVKIVQCDLYAGALEIYRRGFLRSSGDGRYLVHADGSAFFYLGDTHWIMPHERFDTSNAPGVASQFKYVVDRRVNQGFTVFQSEPIWQAHGAAAHNRPDEERQADLRDGFTAADLPGFANLDRKFQYIADKGLVHANAQIDWALNPANFPVFTEAYMARVARYWVARYGAYPVIWTMAQEIDKNMYGAYTATTLNRWFAAGQSVADNDAYRHPIMPHMENTGSTVATSSTWSDKAYHGGWAVQWQGEMNDVATAKNFWNFAPARPSVLYEAQYDQFWTDARGALGAGYKAFQYGMYGYGYGVAGVWNDIYSKPGETGDYGTDYEMPARYLWWYDGANLATGNQLTYLKNFYTSLEWWNLVPRFDDAAWVTFTDASRSLLASDGRKTLVTFFFGAGTATGTLRNLENGTVCSAQWFNPRNGQYTSLPNFTVANGTYAIPGRPTAEDWVLLVRKTGGGDATAPAAVANLSVQTGYVSAVVSWTAPGDDGNAGTAVAYDLRYSPSPITVSNWANARQVPGTPVPGAPGTAQSVRVHGLLPNTLYYFALRTKDDVPNLSALSNVASASTAASSPNLALARTYRSLSNYNAGQTGPNAFDEDTSTNWQSATGTFAGQWLEVNFGAATAFNKIVLYEYGRRTTGYRIEYTSDTVWRTAYTGTAITNGDTVTFASATGSKARIYFLSGSGMPIVFEFGIYGPGSTGLAKPAPAVRRGRLRVSSRDLMGRNERGRKTVFPHLEPRIISASP